MRFSQQRETVKNIVRGTNSHPTAEWVYTQTKKVIPNISLGTVYRNLKTLQETGQINIIPVSYTHLTLPTIYSV